MFFSNNFTETFRKKNRKRLVITFLTKSDVLIFPNKSKWTELIDLLADDVRGRHCRSVYVHFIAHRLNKHGFSCPTWAKQENATRKWET